MRYKFVLLLVVATIIVSGCTTTIQKPTVSVDGIDVTGVNPQTLNLNVNIIVDNPNPVGANLTKISFDVYYLRDNQTEYLGHGEKNNVEIRKEGQTTITVPVVVQDQQAIGALIEVAKKGAVTIKISGTADLDLKVTTFGIPFEATKEVTLQIAR